MLPMRTRTRVSVVDEGIAITVGRRSQPKVYSILEAGKLRGEIKDAIERWGIERAQESASRCRRAWR